MADQMLICSGCSRRYKAPTYNPSKTYLCPECNQALRLESEEISVVADDARGSREQADRVTSEDPLVGRAYGQYLIVSKLGQGGMGTVYLAQHTKLGRDVALKFLPAQLVQEDPSYVARFEREARAAAALDHPNVVTVYAVGELEGRHYIEMEFVEGCTLQDYLAANGSLSVREASYTAIQVAEALRAAHAKSLIHRDVKPANVMLRDDGRVKVMDFGLAKDTRASSQLTAGGIVGTPYYMSPEQCDGEDLDGRSDIYSLGVMYYHMLTGELPFKGASAIAILLQHKTEPPSDPRSIKPDLPEAVCRIVGKTLAKDPRDRYQTCEELIAGLRVFAGNMGKTPAFDSQVLSAGNGPAFSAYEDVVHQGREEPTNVPPAEAEPPPEAAADTTQTVVLQDPGGGRPSAPTLTPVPEPQPQPQPQPQTPVEVDLYEVAMKAAREAVARQDSSAVIAQCELALRHRPNDEEALRLREYAKSYFAITSEPPGAQVFVDGEAIGPTPVPRFEVASGKTYRVEARLQGWAAQPQFVPVERFGEVALHFRMATNRLPSGLRKAFALPMAETDHHGNPVVTSGGEKFDPHTGYPYELWLSDLQMELVLVPAGEFEMGSRSGQFGAGREAGRYRDEGPVHVVRISRPFYLGKYPVTQEQYRHVASENPSYFPGDGRPVDSVSWHEAVAFCERLSAVTGAGIGLPTEAQWEYACRAGTNTAYSFGDTPSQIGDHAWYYRNAHGQTHPVGKKRPNRWGLFDMHGNVGEWCRDGKRSYSGTIVADPVGPDESSRVLRGGSWSSPPRGVRCADRHDRSSSRGGRDYGFRVAVYPSVRLRAR